VLSGHGCKIALSGYYAAKKRLPAKRWRRDAEVLSRIVGVHSSRSQGRHNFGARKVWVELGKEQQRGEHLELGAVPRCQVERLMRAHCLRGRRRGRQFITTRPDPKVDRPPDRVERKFEASRPNQLWVVDFTYVSTWAGTAFTAFVIDVYSRRIVGWRVAGRMPTALPLDALEMALWTRTQTNQLVEGLILHSDAGSQGEINRSSQHHDMEVFDGSTSWVDAGVDGQVTDGVAGCTGASQGGRAAVLA